MPYKEPTEFKKVGDVILTNFGQEVELQERRINDEPNSTFTQYSHAKGRIWLKNGKTLRILVEVVGVIDKNNPIATGVASCKPLEYQTFYIRARVEKPTSNIPVDEQILTLEEIL